MIGGALALALIWGCGGSGGGAASSSASAASSGEPEASAEPSSEGGTLVFFSRIYGDDLQVGDGEVPGEEATLLLRYRMELTDGRVVEQSGEQPVKRLAGDLLPGWERGLKRPRDEAKRSLEPMRVGGERRLKLPPEWAFGHPENSWPRPAGVDKHDAIIVTFTLVGVE